MDTVIPLRGQRDNDLVRLLLKHKYYLVELRGLEPPTFSLRRLRPRGGLPARWATIGCIKCIPIMVMMSGAQMGHTTASIPGPSCADPSGVRAYVKHKL
jgi:hypothetical protein